MLRLGQAAGDWWEKVLPKAVFEFFAKATIELPPDPFEDAKIEMEEMERIASSLRRGMESIVQEAQELASTASWDQNKTPADMHAYASPDSGGAPACSILSPDGLDRLRRVSEGIEMERTGQAESNAILLRIERELMRQRTEAEKLVAKSRLVPSS